MITRRARSLQLIALALFAALLPFELKTPLVTLDPIVLTNVEVLLYALIVWWIVGVLWARRVHWTLVHSAVLTWLIIQFVTAFLAPVERAAALKFALRSAGGAALFFIAADWIRSGRRAAWIMSAVAIGVMVSAGAGLLEVQSDVVQAALLCFKTQASLVGGQLRASGTFQYANTAAMYWEAALPVLIAVGVWWSIGRGQRRWLALALLAGLGVIEAIVLSASRAAVVSTALALGIMIIADRASQTRSGLARSGVVSLSILGVLTGVELIVNPVFAARLRSENDDTWFRARLHPQQSEFSAAAGDLITTTLVVTNTSPRPWLARGQRPVHVSYHWIQPHSRRVLILDGERTPLPHDLAPGEAAIVAAFVKVPSVTGAWLLQWDMVQEDVTWFSERGGAVAEVKVQVVPARQNQVSVIVPASGQLKDTTSPPRLELWRAGVQMWLSHPFLGVGPDNFRHTYGPYLGQATFDDRITANSWYVELLATTGAVGLLSWWLIPGAVIVTVRRQWRMVTQRDRVLVIGWGTALLAFVLHGLVDYFMEFTPTYGLFWLIAGSLVGLLAGEHDVEFAGTADRV
ncbi:hypothetical protein TFLX_02808 [Thermoflexales bacterium]|nr:hypothetical protein TFLX_02808 [Thermoflexales bacterium]